MRSLRLFALFAAGAAASQAGLIHQYTFDTDAGDSVLVGALDGSLQNGATVSGGTLHLDRSTSSYVEFSGFVVPTSGSYTVSFDEKANSYSGIHEFISQGQSGGPGFYIGFDGGLNFRIGDAWGFGGVGYPVDTNTWHNVTLVVDSLAGDFTVYVDYVSVGTHAVVPFTGLSGTPTPTRFGRQFSGYSEFFDGEMDNVRVFDEALSLSELTSTPEPSSFLLAGLAVAFLVRKSRAA